MTRELVRLDIVGAIAVLTIDRAEKRNALNLAIWAGLEAHLDSIDARGDEIGVVVLRSDGSVFCAGNDLKERGVALPRPNYQAGIITRLADLVQPVIVAVQGGCFTGGLELALAGDVIMAAESAQFADTHGKFALIPVWGMTQRLPRRIGFAKASELSLSGLPVGGREAERIGLANHCVPDTELDSRSMALAEAMAAQSRHSLFAYKQLYRAQCDLALDAGLAHEINSSVGAGPDMADRIAGFTRG